MKEVHTIAQRVTLALASLVLLTTCQSRPRDEAAPLTYTKPMTRRPIPKAELEQSPSPLADAQSKTPKPTPTTRPTLTPNPEESPTASHSPPTTPSSTATPQLRILSFEATPQEADPGDTVTLTWTSEGAARATLYRLLQNGQFPEHGTDVPPTGSITYTIDPRARNWVNFLLYAWNHAGASDNEGATVILRCPYAWFFDPPPDENVCPTAPQTSLAAEQSFERGTMLWIEAEDAIYVLYADEDYTTRWSRFQDEWEEEDPDRDPNLNPPPGLQQPIRGFGLVWRTYPSVRERLGWALGPERGYQTTTQWTTRYKYNATYIRAEDGSVWYLGPERSSWDKIESEQSP